MNTTPTQDKHDRLNRELQSAWFLYQKALGEVVANTPNNKGMLAAADKIDDLTGLIFRARNQMTYERKRA